MIALRASNTHGGINSPTATHRAAPTPDLESPTKEINTTRRSVMNLFRLDGSFREEGSQSRAIADIVENQWTATGGGDVTRRHIGAEPIPSTYWAAAASFGYTPEEYRTELQHTAVALATELVDELVAADALLFAVPLYNFGVSQHFKAYIDLVLTEERMAPTAPGQILGGKPV
ncbi:NAD(P)H-dependent oxidoreductase [Phycicoccus sp. CSK15P-2]|uniref:NAD(P)H-dependent oxidoreductase n=1 Tax=Phycicoccus sp. CSK15P-2 TaxID=2807627 RepID=UPI00194E8C2A|nr:NAD(P)H-dependent oxidoreductase [Phycicoccus sp. CSK15P-2]MBM6402661.1 NAD(P)H-dependent oxidoreductase [Phycicoccus sp. CSK15P-2]